MVTVKEVVSKPGQIIQLRVQSGCLIIEHSSRYGRVTPSNKQRIKLQFVWITELYFTIYAGKYFTVIKGVHMVEYQAA
jgi:hypothetical protein